MAKQIKNRKKVWEKDTTESESIFPDNPKLKEELPASEKEIIKQILTEEKMGRDFIESKRKLFLRRWALYNPVNDNGEIEVHLIYSVINMLVAISYQDEMSVNFAGRQLNDQDVADNLQNLAEFDYDEMKLEEKNYSKEWNRFFYGVGIRVFSHWDKERKVPVYEDVDPLSWRPDPNGFLNNHRFHGFEKEVKETDLNPEIFFNLDKIKPSKSSDKKEESQRKNSVRKLNSQTDAVDTDKQPVYDLYDHWTRINGDVYLCTLSNNKSLLIRCKKFEPVTLAEKKDKNLIDFPVILYHYSPISGDPFGVSVPDLLEDKQEAMKLFANLNKIKAEHEAWGDMFLVDPDVIENTNDLIAPSDGPKYIKANLGSNPNPVIPIPRGQIKSDAFNMPQVLQNQANFDIGLDERSLGVAGESNITATENQRIQKNANIKLVLQSKVNQWGEKRFWKNWHRNYLEYFDWGDEKNIALNNAFGNTIYTVRRKDIFTSSDIDIKVISKSEKDALTEMEKAGYMAIANTIINNPAKPAISRAFAERKLYKLLGIKKDEVMALVPESPDEAIAKDDIQLLNNDVMPIVPESVEEMQQDHMTYLIIYHRAIDTKAKTKAIAIRRKLYELSGQMQNQNAMMGMGAAGGMANQTQSQLTSNFIGQQNKQENGAASVENIS